MPTTLDANGLSIASPAELDSNFVTGMTEIFGADTNFDSNSPDGQDIGIRVQAIYDYLTVLIAIYNMFDPDNCQGIQQDNLYWINFIKRKGATFSLQNISITVDRALTLPGLDAASEDPDGVGFTVADNLGNQWILLDTQTPSGAGTNSYVFRAKSLGSNVSAPNTITVPVSVIVGVTAINNPTGVTSVGQDGESDPDFRNRRSISAAKRTTNAYDGMYADLLNLDGVISAAVYENDGPDVDSDGIPGHGFWPIVEGGSNQDIANTIYRNAVKALPSKGDESVSLVTIQNQIYTAKFDRPATFPIYIKFNLKPLKLGQTFDESAIKAYFVTNKIYKINEAGDTGTLTDIALAAVNAVAGVSSGAVLALKISSDNATWVDYLAPATKKDKWIIDAANISITLI